MLQKLSDITGPITNHDTWNTCLQCMLEWKSPIATLGIIHRTVLCPTCKEFNELSKRDE